MSLELKGLRKNDLIAELCHLPEGCVVTRISSIMWRKHFEVSFVLDGKHEFRFVPMTCKQVTVKRGLPERAEWRIKQ